MGAACSTVTPPAARAGPVQSSEDEAGAESHPRARRRVCGRADWVAGQERRPRRVGQHARGDEGGEGRDGEERVADGVGHDGGGEEGGGDGCWEA